MKSLQIFYLPVFLWYFTGTLDPSTLARRLFYPPVLWRGGGPNPSNLSNLFENELHSFPSTKSEMILKYYVKPALSRSLHKMQGLYNLSGPKS